MTAAIFGLVGVLLGGLIAGVAHVSPSTTGRLADRAVRHA
jgi:hypothetical protein